MIDARHGSPYDRGSADSYYGRSFNPHYFTEDSCSSDKVDLEEMTPQEIVEYTKGFNENEESGNFKYWD
tara:strand:- start:689 stop:895 length:207 start_codon:yes stop_codon:yes gene_type:complete